MSWSKEIADALTEDATWLAEETKTQEELEIAIRIELALQEIERLQELLEELANEETHNEKGGE